ALGSLAPGGRPADVPYGATESSLGDRAPSPRRSLPLAEFIPQQADLLPDIWIGGVAPGKLPLDIQRLRAPAERSKTSGHRPPRPMHLVGRATGLVGIERQPELFQCPLVISPVVHG